MHQITIDDNTFLQMVNIVRKRREKTSLKLLLSQRNIVKVSVSSSLIIANIDILIIKRIHWHCFKLDNPQMLGWNRNWPWDTAAHRWFAQKRPFLIIMNKYGLYRIIKRLIDCFVWVSSLIYLESLRTKSDDKFYYVIQRHPASQNRSHQPYKKRKPGIISMRWNPKLLSVQWLNVRR